MADTIDKPVDDTGYETDFYLWTQQQAQRLRDASRDRINAPIDWENVAEEIESVGISDRREVRSLARHIMVHLIALRCTTHVGPRDHWKQEIGTARDKLEDVLEDSPSLKARFSELVEGEWDRAVREAKRKLATDEAASHEVSELVFLGFVGADAARVLDPSFFPTPTERP